MKKRTKAVDPKWQPTKKWKLVAREKRIQVPVDALEPRNVKVRVNMYLDLDVIEFFKKRAAEPGAAAYQTQINAELRRVMEEAERPEADPVTTLRQASRMINSAAVKLEKRRPAS